MKPEDAKTRWPDSDFTLPPARPHIQATGEAEGGRRASGCRVQTPRAPREEAHSVLATSPPSPNVFHPFPPPLQQARLHRLLAAPWQTRRTDGQLDGQPSRSQQSFPARGRSHSSGSALDAICNSAFKGFVAEAHCLHSRSRKIIVELNSQEQLERKREKIPTLNVKGHFRASRFRGFLMHLNAFARPCGCTVFHFTGLVQCKTGN